MNLLLDTNILIDYFGRRRPYFDDWYKLIVMREMGDADLWVSAKSFTDVFYALRKAVGSSELQAAFIESLGFLRVCSVGDAEIRAAAERGWPDFEDSLVDVCAKNVAADCIITRDQKGFSRSSIPSMSIPDFFAYLEEEYGIVYDEARL